MAVADYYIRKDDTLPVIGITAELADGSIVDLTGGVYHFLITNTDTGITVDRAATLDGLATLGKLKYQWVAADTLTPGYYRGKFRVVFGGSAPITFPNNTDILIQVYDAPPGGIITNPQDVNSIRASLGLEKIDFSDESIQGLLYLQEAELDVSDLVDEMAAKTNGLVPTVAQIMANPPISPAVAKDKQRLKMAVANYVAYFFGPSATNAINTSITVGKQTVDRGGVGSQWEIPMQIAYDRVGKNLSKITGWPDQTQTLFSLSGPTSSGTAPNTVSGLWVTGRRW